MVTLFKQPIAADDPKPWRRRVAPRIHTAAAVMLLIAIGHASVSYAAESVGARINDPFERLNRKGFAIQMKLTRHGLGPIGAIFRFLTPGPIGKALHHILVNLSEPGVVINDILQLRPARAGRATIRFVVNSTAGLGGVIDVVGATGIPHHLSSFGDTLGRYHVKPGPYLFIPIIGPSTVRDLFGNVVDAVVDPMHFAVYPYRQEVSLGVAVVGGLDQLVRTEGDLATLLSSAADPYATLRSTYLQNREAEVTGATSAPLVLPNLDDTDAPALPPSDAAARETGATDNHAPPLEDLPDEQHRRADDKIARPLDQGQGHGDIGTETEQRPQNGVAGLLNADTHGGDEHRAASGQDQRLQTDHGERADADAGHIKGQPHPKGAGSPGEQMQADGQRQAARAPVQALD